MARLHPTRGFETREDHRAALLLHALAMMVGIVAAAAANRFLSPDRLWFHWVALGWAGAFGLHLWRFARGTLATMGGGRRESRSDRDR